MSDKLYALSVKQPWAALLAAGVKTVEVRTWPTTRRGTLLIHASKIPDERPEAWAWVTTPELTEAAKLRGGVVGVGELVGCVVYSTAARFTADRGRPRPTLERAGVVRRGGVIRVRVPGAAADPVRRVPGFDIIL